MHDVEAQRPSAHILCERLELLKGTSDYSDRTHIRHTDQSAEFEQCWVSDEILLRCMQRSRTLLNQLRENYHTVSDVQQDNNELRKQLSQSGQEITRLQQRNALLDEEVQSLQKQVRVSEQQMRRAEVTKQSLKIELGKAQHKFNSERQVYLQNTRQLQEFILMQKECIASRDREIDHLKQQVMLLDQQRIQSREGSIVKNEVERQISKRLSQNSLDHYSVRTLSVTSEREEETIPHQNITFHLEWSSDRKKAPCGMAAHCNTIRCSGIVYLQSTNTISLYVYNTTDIWNHLRGGTGV